MLAKLKGLPSLKNMSPGEMLKKAWGSLNTIPGGKTLFSKLVGQYIPYTGSIRPTVLELQAGKAQVELKDRRGVRNHLNSIHALALANLGEFTTGLAVISALPKNAQCILVNLEAQYLKKARGTLKSEATFEFFHNSATDSEFKVEALIKNAQHEVVSRVQATWRVRL